MTRARAAGAPASPYGRRLRDSSSRSINTNASGKIHTNNNRRQVGPLQAIAPGPAQAIVFTLPQAERTPVFLVFDELQALTELPLSIERTAERARGLGGGLVVGTQTLGRLPESTRHALLG